MATPQQHDQQPHYQVVALYVDAEEAEAAVEDLRREGLPTEGLAQPEDARAAAAEAEMAAEANRTWPIPALALGTEGMTQGWVAGTVAGTVVGAAIGLVVGLVTLSLGWLVVGVLAGGVAGATAGFILGGSFGAIEADQRRRPAAEADNGGRLLAETGAAVSYTSADQVTTDRAREILERHGPIRLTTHH